MAKLKRQRGAVLTSEGIQKLETARKLLEAKFKDGKRFTFDELSERTGLDINTVKKVLSRQHKVDMRTIENVFAALDLELSPTDYTSTIGKKHLDWGDAKRHILFYGRTEELALLEKQILENNCQLMAILGMGGIGKTSLSIKLAEQLQDKFDYFIWRSLREAPPAKALLADLIQFLSNQEETELNLPNTVSDRVSRLLDYLQKYRCLLIIDNVESILCGQKPTGEYRPGCEGYGELFMRVGKVTHRSCLLLTSREKPKEIALLEEDVLSVCCVRLGGLQESEVLEILNAKRLYGSESDYKAIIEHYTGHPLAIKIIATSIVDWFDGSISQFLQQNSFIFGDIREILQEQFERLSRLEKDVMYWLAINREPIKILQLQEDVVSNIPITDLLEATESLHRRSLIEKTESCFTLQAVVMEYVTQKFVAEVCQEIELEKFALFQSHALMKATAKDYVKEVQIRFILQPVMDKLFNLFKSQKRIQEHLTQILATLRATSPREQSYAAGNVINLLCNLGIDLSGYDFSELGIWQADLRNVKLHDVNFQNSDLAKSVFAETFGGVLSVACSPDGKLLATGDTKGEICLRQVADGKQVQTYKAHTNWVLSLAFSPDSKTIASGSTDHTVKLWDISTGQCLQTLRGHDHEVWSVAFSPHGDTVASGSDDKTIKLWSVSTGECLRTFHGHTSWVCSVAFIPVSTASLKGIREIVVSGSDDQTIRLWDVNTGECLKILQGHSDGIRSIAVSSDGLMLTSGSEDQTVKLWNISTGKCK